MNRLRSSPGFFLAAGLLVALDGCSAPQTAHDAARHDDVFVTDTTVGADASDAADTTLDPDVASTDASDVPLACVHGATTAAIAHCLDTTRGPNDCLADAQRTATAPLCDDDGDGLADDLEDALATAYALAFAYNRGDGSHAMGNPEPHWPDNLAHFVSGSNLIWRLDGDNTTVHMVDANPSLATLDRESATVDGSLRFANNPATTHGGDFWLCLDQPGGSYTPDSMVTNMDASRTLAGGIDVTSVVHPAGGISGVPYAFVATMLFYPYNEHSTIDNHEGDWEGGAVLVNMTTGQVAAVYLDRHDSVDNVRLLPLVGSGAVPVIDPATEASFGDICSETDAAAARGVRFWDAHGPHHHPIAYVATGGHSAYPYPGNTKITGLGCLEISIVRDTHNGDNARLLPWRASYASGWTDTPASPVVNGVHMLNAGEVRAPRGAWAGFRGQWGCQNDTIAKSWPGPFGNQRHCRAWITSGGWGAAPFTVPTTGCP